MVDGHANCSQPSSIIEAAISPNALRRKVSAHRVASENYSDVRPLVRLEPATTEDTPQCSGTTLWGPSWDVSLQVHTVRRDETPWMTTSSTSCRCFLPCLAPPSSLVSAERRPIVLRPRESSPFGASAEGSTW